MGNRSIYLGLGLSCTGRKGCSVNIFNTTLTVGRHGGARSMYYTPTRLHETQGVFGQYIFNIFNSMQSVGCTRIRSM